MKRKITAAVAALCFMCLMLCAFTFDPHSSVKTLTHPYINTYYCTQARLGDTDLLEKYEYFIITVLDDSELEISFKKIDGQKHTYKSNYTYDETTHELIAEIGILGFPFKQKATIENGKFSICMPIFNKPLVMIFEIK